MENIKHKEMTVPGVAFHSADGVDKQSLRYTLQWMSTRIRWFQWAWIWEPQNLTFATAPLSLDQPPPLCIARTSLVTLLFSFIMCWF